MQNHFQGVGSQIAQVFLAENYQGIDESQAVAGGGAGKGICLILVRSRQSIDKQCHEDRQGTEKYSKKDKTAVNGRNGYPQRRRNLRSA